MSTEPKFTHLDDQGRARMVDVSEKEPTIRTARAVGRIRATASTVRRLLEGDLPKGEAVSVARVAGIQGAKRCSELIPLCHPIGLDAVEVDIRPGPEDGLIEVEAVARCRGRTGVEMEAMTAVSVTLLTLYDMAKGIERTMVIEEIMLMEKKGGRSGHWQREMIG